jgi:hypothetical protein
VVSRSSGSLPSATTDAAELRPIRGGHDRGRAHDEGGALASSGASAASEPPCRTRRRRPMRGRAPRPEAGRRVGAEVLERHGHGQRLARLPT